MELPWFSIFNSVLETKNSRIVSVDILVCKWVTEICFPDKMFQWKPYEIFCWGAWHFCSNLMGLDWSVLVGWSQMSLRSFWAQVQNQLFYWERFECLAHNILKNKTTALVEIRIQLQEFNVAHWCALHIVIFPVHCFFFCQPCYNRRLATISPIRAVDSLSCNPTNQVCYTIVVCFSMWKSKSTTWIGIFFFYRT